MTHKELTTAQMKIINHILFHVEMDYSGTIRHAMSINKTDIKHIEQIRKKLLKEINK